MVNGINALVVFVIALSFAATAGADTCRIPAGLRHFQELPSETKGSLALSLARLSSCNFGDLDLIARDIEIDRSRSLALRLAFSRLDQPTGNGDISIEIQRGEVGKILGGSLALPGRSIPDGHYMLQLCGMRELTSPGCRRAVISSFKEALNDYVPTDGTFRAQQGEVPERLYFSQPLVVRCGRFFAAQELMTTSAYEDLRLFGLSSEHITAVRQVGSVTQSLPVTSRGATTTIELPAFDGARCG